MLLGGFYNCMDGLGGYFFVVRVITCIFSLDGLSLGDYLCGVSWYWMFIYFYYDGDH